MQWRRRLFVPIVAEVPVPAPEPMAASARTTPTIEIKLAGVVLRVGAGTDADLLTTVLRAIRASAV